VPRGVVDAEAAAAAADADADAVASPSSTAKSRSNLASNPLAVVIVMCVPRSPTNIATTSSGFFPAIDSPLTSDIMSVTCSPELTASVSSRMPVIATPPARVGHTNRPTVPLPLGAASTCSIFLADDTGGLAAVRLGDVLATMSVRSGGICTGPVFVCTRVVLNEFCCCAPVWVGGFGGLGLEPFSDWEDPLFGGEPVLDSTCTCPRGFETGEACAFGAEGSDAPSGVGRAMFFGCDIVAACVLLLLLLLGLSELPCGEGAAGLFMGI
jgi:hypothetical protein